MWRADSFEKTLMLGKIEGRRRRGWQRMRWWCWMASPTRWTWVWVNWTELYWSRYQQIQCLRTYFLLVRCLFPCFVLTKQNSWEQSPLTSFIRTLILNFTDCPVVKNLSMQGTSTGSIPGSGKFHMLWGNWVHVPQPLNLSALESMLCNKRVALAHN